MTVIDVLSVIALWLIAIALAVRLIVESKMKPAAEAPPAPARPAPDALKDVHFIELKEKDGADLLLNVSQIRTVFVPNGDGNVEIVYGTGNNYQEITRQEFDEKLRAVLLKITL